MMPARCAGTALLLTLLEGAVGLPGLAAQERPFTQDRDLVITGGRLFTAVADTLVANPGILVRAGKLLVIGPEAMGLAAEDARHLRLTDAEVALPGLFDLHAHYAMDLFGEGRVDETDVNPVIFLANGVTSTFPAGEMDPDRMRAVRLAIDAGLRPGPRIHSSGPYFGTARPGWDPGAMSADSIAREVDYWAARGALGFKAKGIRPVQLDALIRAAHRHGLTVTGHLDSGFRESVNPRDAIRMGIDRIEHFIGGDALTGDRPAYASLEALDTDRSEVGDAIRLFVQHGARFDATLTAYAYFGERDAEVFEGYEDERAFLTPYAREVVDARLPRRVSDSFERIYRVKKRTVRRFVEEGGADLLTLGTDHPSWGEFLSGFGAHRELHAMVISGIPEAVALRAGTINGARALGLADRLGSLEVGKLADLFVIDGDPLQDIRRTRRVRHVVRAGVLFDPVELLDSVRGRLGPGSAADDAAWKGSETRD
jgi:imidazolonepropionase-like amidohydrolase